jgi:septal ring factor EnvC (AmiA/AmiB activator)
MAEIVPGRSTGGPVEDFTQTRKREEAAALRKKQQEEEAKRKAAAQQTEAERKKKAKEAATTINPVGFLQKPLQFITQSEDIPKPLKGTPFEAPAEFIQ